MYILIKENKNILKLIKISRFKNKIKKFYNCKERKLIDI